MNRALFLMMEEVECSCWVAGVGIQLSVRH